MCGERQRGGDGGAEAGSVPILITDSLEPDEVLKLTNHDIITWAEVEHLTDWANPGALKWWEVFFQIPTSLSITSK